MTSTLGAPVEPIDPDREDPLPGMPAPPLDLVRIDGLRAARRAGYSPDDRPALDAFLTGWCAATAALRPPF